MAELTLEPYAAVQRWTIRPAGLEAGPSLEGLLKQYLEALAAACQAVENTVIGHIKALALFPDGKYLRLSAVAAHLPATLDGAAPPGCTSLEVTLNVLVYGLPAGQAQAITQAAAQALVQQYPLTIEFVRPAHPGTARHPHPHE